MSIDFAAASSGADPTLEAVARAQEADQNRKARPYLGASSIGRPCARALWYGFRHVAEPDFDADTLRRFEDGFAGEDMMIERLRAVRGIVLLTRDPQTGRQYGFADETGHIRGHADGMIEGLLQAPKTQHVWEHKQVGDKKFAELEKYKKQGEKSALKMWDETYYAQAVVYMHWSGLTRHYLTCSTPGGRKITSVRTNASAKDAKRYLARGLQIVTSQEPPQRLSDDPSFWQCKFCDFHAQCHGKTPAMVNCRTCIHATPETDGEARWSCAWHQIEFIPEHGQREGCGDHRYIPQLFPPAKAVDADPDKNTVAYEAPDGLRFVNGERARGSFASTELYRNAANLAALLSDEAQELREAFL